MDCQICTVGMNVFLESQNSALVLKEHAVLWMDNCGAAWLEFGVPKEAKRHHSQI